jgi:hypothetical protein
LDACSFKSVEKGQLYEVYDHYLHYSVFVSTTGQEKTAMPVTMFLQTWNGFEIHPS